MPGSREKEQWWVEAVHVEPVGTQKQAKVSTSPWSESGKKAFGRDLESSNLLWFFLLCHVDTSRPWSIILFPPRRKILFYQTQLIPVIFIQCKKPYNHVSWISFVELGNLHRSKISWFLFYFAVFCKFHSLIPSPDVPSPNLSYNYRIHIKPLVVA